MLLLMEQHSTFKYTTAKITPCIAHMHRETHQSVLQCSSVMTVTLWLVQVYYSHLNLGWCATSSFKWKANCTKSLATAGNI